MKYFHHCVLESGPCSQLYSSEESRFCHWEDLEQVISTRRPQSMWMSFPLSNGPFLGSSVRTGLEPSPNSSHTHALRDPPSAWDQSTMNLCKAQMRRRKRNSQCEHIQGPIVEPLPLPLFSGAGWEEGRLEVRSRSGKWQRMRWHPALLRYSPSAASNPFIQPLLLLLAPVASHRYLGCSKSHSFHHSKPVQLAL